MARPETGHGSVMLEGHPAPLGATCAESGEISGVNFAIWSENASRVELCVFEDGWERRYTLPARTEHVWHGFLPGAGAGLQYAYRVHGEYDPAHGHRFNANKLLIDPYARRLHGEVVNDDRLHGERAATHGVVPDIQDSAPVMPRCVVVEDHFDWGDSRAPGTKLVDTVVYELHVKGYTRLHPDIPANLRGTYLGLAQPVITDHLRRLGVTAIELLPCATFMTEMTLAGRGLSNFWGYNTMAFFAPHAAYACDDPVTEFQAMVRAMHEAGIEVIVDVVYNHTAEGDGRGPTLSFRGIDNASYYHLVDSDRSLYVNNSGCGNSVAVDHPAVMKLVLDSLRYWVEVLHVDGFRFDLGPSLARVNGEFSQEAAFFQAVYQDPVLSRVKLIAEPWDVGHAGYRLGQFPAGWSEWNDRYRNTVRSFWRGDRGGVGELASRLSGSSDIFPGRGPTASVNYVTSHDGFTLDDLVSHENRHNESNGENNADGDRHNHSWNHGVEGPTTDEKILARRAGDKRALLATLLFSHGIPMVLAGDELGRTQRGNNNAYCQDNEISWVDWERVDQSLVDYVARLIALRRQHAVFRRQHHLNGPLDGPDSPHDVEWLTAKGGGMQPAQWQEGDRQALQVCLRSVGTRGILSSEPDAHDALLLLNASAKSVEFVLPAEPRLWNCVLDSAVDSPPYTRAQPGSAPAMHDDRYRALAGSFVLLIPVNPRTTLIMGERSILDSLARKMGIETGYYDFRGEHRTVPTSSCRHILAAMGFDDRDPDSQSAAIQSHEERQWRRLIPHVCVVKENSGCRISLHMPETQLDEKLRWRLWYEDGRLLSGILSPSKLDRVDHRELDGTLWVRCEADLPDDLGAGYHELVVHAPGRSEGWVCRVIVTPEVGYEPPVLQRGERVWGLSVQLYSLRSDRNWGIGDFGDLKHLAWKAGRAGADVLGLNPLHALFPASPGHFSPYSPSSRFFLNFLYIDVPGIPEAAQCASLGTLLRDPAFRSRIENLRASDRVDYEAVTEVKLAALRMLFEDFRANHLKKATARAREFQQFVTESGPALETHALFDALHAHFARRNPGSAGWQDWPPEYADPCSDAVMRFALRHRESIDFYQYLQWIADEQLAEAQTAAIDAGMSIGLYRDLAVGVSPDGSENWANQRIYVQHVTIGAPPDPLALKGQDWGLPPMHPGRLAQQAYAGFVQLMRSNMRDCGALRIDHVMGLLRLWWVPSDSDATEGAYVYYPFDELVGIVALESQRARCLVIGEDLGTVPDQVREVLPAAAVYSYRVLMFEKNHDGSFRHPSAYPHRALATISTHDLPPLYSFWDGSDIRLRQQLALYPDEQTENHVIATRGADRSALLRALAETVGDGFETGQMNADLMTAIHQYLARSGAAIVMAQPEDWLGMTEPVNIPGTTTAAYPNWRRKLNCSIDEIIDHPDARQLFATLNAERG